MENALLVYKLLWKQYFKEAEGLNQELKFSSSFHGLKNMECVGFRMWQLTFFQEKELQ